MKAISAVAAALLLILAAGCETQSAREGVFVKPSVATVVKGQSVELVAEGGYDYRWSLKYEGWGTLSTRRGNRVVYTSRAAASEVTGEASQSGPVDTQIVYAMSMITDSPLSVPGNYPGSGSTGTNTASTSTQVYQVTGAAYITHL